MKSFDDVEVAEEYKEPPTFQKYDIQKQKLLFNLTRSKEVMDYVYQWLTSFEGGISKQTFLSQIGRLSSDDKVAVEQLKKSMGRRSIAKIRVALPPLPMADDVIQMLAKDILFIAVAGKEEALRAFIRNSYQTLKTCGTTYVLDLNDMRLEWVDKFQKGKSAQMLQKSKDSDFLIIVGLETPLDMPFYMGDALNTLRRYRVEHRLPMISTFARFREKEKFFEYFEKFRVN